MFGFSITKLALLAAIIAAVWYGFKMIGRLDQLSKTAAAKGARRASGQAADDGSIDTVSCAVCGTFVAAGEAKPCGRQDCPYSAQPTG